MSDPRGGVGPLASAHSPHDRAALSGSSIDRFEPRSGRLDGGEHDLVFPSAVGTLREVATVERQWRGFRERHPEFAWIKLHTIRKTVATHVDRGRGTDAAAA